MYSKEEKQRRLNAAAALIEKENLNAILLLGNGTVGTNAFSNYRYFTDNRSSSNIGAALITKDAKLWAVVGSVMAKNHMIKNTFVDNPVIFPDRLGWHINYLKENNLHKGKLGTLLEVMPTAWYLRIQKELPELEIVDVSAQLFEIRTHKSLEEAEVHRQCAKIALDGYNAFIKTAVPGAYEHEVVAETIGAMQKYGCDDFFMLVASGKFSSEYNKMTTLHNAAGIDRKLEDGDAISMEITPYFNGCWTQLVRTVCVGKENPAVTEFVEITKKAIAAATAVIKPGVPIFSLVKEMRTVIEGAGYRLAMPCGHICGADLNEERLTEDNDRLLLPGMCVIIHPTVLNDNIKSGIYWGETYLVTETGVEALM